MPWPLATTWPLSVRVPPRGGAPPRRRPPSAARARQASVLLSPLPQDYVRDDELPESYDTRSLLGRDYTTVSRSQNIVVCVVQIFSDSSVTLQDTKSAWSCAVGELLLFSLSTTIDAETL